jgi:hypothetical protein
VFYDFHCILSSFSLLKRWMDSVLTAFVLRPSGALRASKILAALRAFRENFLPHCAHLVPRNSTSQKIFTLTDFFISLCFRWLAMTGKRTAAPFNNIAQTSKLNLTLQSKQLKKILRSLFCHRFYAQLLQLSQFFAYVMYEVGIISLTAMRYRR